MGGLALDGKKISRKKAESIIEKVKEMGLEAISKKWEVCGSFRRKKEEIGDLDIVLIPASLEDYQSWFESLDVEKFSSNLVDSILVEGVQVDFFVATKESYATMIMTWTGSRGFNIVMRGKSFKAGYVYTRNGMYKRGESEVVKGLESEADIFKLIGMPFVPPESR